jgi:hypothetical protein
VTSALNLYTKGALRVARAVSHSGERTLDLCLRAIAEMDGAERLAAHSVVSDVEPVSEAFNRILDFARDVRADVLFHTASDVIVDRLALVSLLAIMDVDKHYQAVARGYDPIFGEGAPVGILIWNMRAVGEHRFRDVYKTDMDMSARVESATGLARQTSPTKLRLGYHHPIWTAPELYKKYLYSFPKYGEKPRRMMQAFLDEALARNPDNSALIMGRAGLERARGSEPPAGAKRNSQLQALYEADRAAHGLPPFDGHYYVHHRRFRDYAQAILRTSYVCRAVDDEA